MWTILTFYFYADNLKVSTIVGMTTYELRLATDCPHNNGVFRTMIFF